MMKRIGLVVLLGVVALTSGCKPLVTPIARGTTKGEIVQRYRLAEVAIHAEYQRHEDFLCAQVAHGVLSDEVAEEGRVRFLDRAERALERARDRFENDMAAWQEGIVR